MSNWEPWVDFVSGHCSTNYTPKFGGTSPCTFNLGLGGLTGDIWASSAGFIRDGFDAASCKRMLDAIDNDDDKVFSEPPTGYTFMRVVDDDGQRILCGKAKGTAGKVVFVGESTTCMHIAVCDIQNPNKGAESEALHSFSKAINEAKNNGI